MDDFRVGSVPASDPYGHRQPSGSIARKRQRQHDDEGGQQADEPADIVELIEAAPADSDSSGDTIEDYYVPSDPDPNSTP